MCSEPKTIYHVNKGSLMAAIDPKEQTRELTSKSAYIALFFSLPVLLAFVFFGDWKMGIGAWICIGLVVLVARSHWDLRESPWFWLSIGVSILLQAPIIMIVPWGNRALTGMSLLPVALVDYGLVCGCVKLAEKMANKSSPPT